MSSQLPACWSASSQTVTVAHCTLLQQLSQDLLDTTSQAEFRTGCDSSDCLLCQGQRQFCNQAITNSVCAWLGRRLSNTNIGAGDNDQPAAAPSSSSIPAGDVQQQAQLPLQLQAQPSSQQAGDEHEGPRKRLKPSPVSTPACSSGLSAADAHTPAVAAGQHSSQQHELQHGAVEQRQPQQQHQQSHVQQPAAPCSRLLGPGSSSSSSWQWQPAFAAFDGPAPARLAEVARLQPAADAFVGHCVGRCDRICGLEFSPDGQLLAAAGVSKQIGLYPMTSVSEEPDAPAAAPPPPGALGGSSSASAQRQQRAQQQQQQQTQQQAEVPLLSPIATLRLPGKVSSIAFSPDMQGVISIGDYDGTLTQVHVASGHYLSEVDAHAGRRIWSVCHSRLRRHFAVTASDDCTARLWSGSGLNTHVATVVAPGRPAVCGADFSSSSEHLLALAAADAKVYLYDMRQLQQPLAALHGHRRPVAYAKFFGSSSLVSASIDGSLAVWDLAPVLGCATAPQPASAAAAAAAGPLSTAAGPGAGLQQQQDQQEQQQQQQQQYQPWKVFRGHTNEKNFVGLSVEPGSGLMAVGSETSDVFAYHTSWDSPLASFDMTRQQQPQQGCSLGQQMQQPASVAWPAPPPPQPQQLSVSAVAWQPSCAAAAAQGVTGGVAGAFAPSTVLAAATSTGACRLLTLLHAQ